MCIIYIDTNRRKQTKRAALSINRFWFKRDWIGIWFRGKKDISWRDSQWYDDILWRYSFWIAVFAMWRFSQSHDLISIIFVYELTSLSPFVVFVCDQPTLRTLLHHTIIRYSNMYEDTVIASRRKYKFSIVIQAMPRIEWRRLANLRGNNSYSWFLIVFNIFIENLFISRQGEGVGQIHNPTHYFKHRYAYNFKYIHPILDIMSSVYTASFVNCKGRVKYSTDELYPTCKFDVKRTWLVFISMLTGL